MTLPCIHTHTQTHTHTLTQTHTHIFSFKSKHYCQTHTQHLGFQFPRVMQEYIAKINKLTIMNYVAPITYISNSESMITHTCTLECEKLHTSCFYLSKLRYLFHVNSGKQVVIYHFTYIELNLKAQT